MSPFTWNVNDPAFTIAEYVLASSTSFRASRNGAAPVGAGNARK
jgi:hypothetical protein